MLFKTLQGCMDEMIHTRPATEKYDGLLANMGHLRPYLACMARRSECSSTPEAGAKARCSAISMQAVFRFRGEGNSLQVSRPFSAVLRLNHKY